MGQYRPATVLPSAPIDGDGRGSKSVGFLVNIDDVATGSQPVTSIEEHAWLEDRTVERATTIRKGTILRQLGALAVGATAVCVCLGAVGTASGAVAGSKMRITTIDCTTASCQITVTMTGVVKVIPTGTVTFLLRGAVIGSTAGPCADESMSPQGVAKANATCIAAGLPEGTHKISVNYSGDNYFDPSTTTKSIRVKPAV